MKWGLGQLLFMANNSNYVNLCQKINIKQRLYKTKINKNDKTKIISLLN